MLSCLERIEQKIADLGIKIINKKPFSGADAEYVHLCGQAPRIYINPEIIADDSRYVLLAEELGHYNTAFGDIAAEREVWQCKSELIGRVYAYSRTAPYAVILSMLKQHYYPHEIAEWLNIPIWHLEEAMIFYTSHGKSFYFDDDIWSA